MLRLLASSIILVATLSPATLAGQPSPTALSLDKLNTSAPSAVRRGGPPLSARLARAEARFTKLGPKWSDRGWPEGLVLDGPAAIRVEIRVDPQSANAVGDHILASGGSLKYRNAPSLIEATLPISSLSRIAAADGIRSVTPARRALPQIGASTTQGVALMNIQTAHDAGIDGSGVSIAIIDAFNTNHASLQASGDWPSVVTMVDVEGGGFGSLKNNHGMATLEIAYDVAPGATFSAYEALTVGEWYDAIILAANAGVDVISASLGTTLDGIGDGSALPGSIAEAADSARKAGAAYVNAAGNSRDKHWGGLFSPGTPVESLDWGSGGNVNPIINCIQEGGFIGADLFWDDWQNVDHDYDLYLLEYDPNLADWILREASVFAQSGLAGQTPQETIEYVPDTTLAGLGCPVGTGAFGFYVHRFSAATNRNLQFFSYREVLYTVPGRSIVFPADAPHVLAVGAVDPDTLQPREFSSTGPILAPGGGISTDTLLGRKPDVVAFARVDTESFGPATFGGTSAAAPHVAGLAALILQKEPALSVDSLYVRIRQWAAKNDLWTTGFDNRTGFGKATFHPDTLLFTGRAFLEGPYSEGTMATGAVFEGAIPNSQPYDDPIFDGTLIEYDTAVSVSSLPANAVDWIKLQLRSDPTTVVGEQVGFVLTDGTIVDTAGVDLIFPCVPADSFFVVVGHRNHQAIMSAEKVNFASGAGNWDFTTALTRAYTNSLPPMQDLGDGSFGLFAGNATPDKQTLANDFNAWLTATKSAQTGYLQADFDLDGQVTATDFNLWLPNTKAAAACQVP